MTIMRITLITLGILIIAGGRSYGGPGGTAMVFSGPIPVDTGDGRKCNAVNVSDKTFDVVTKESCSNGDGSTNTCPALAPGEICGAGGVAFASSSGSCSCQISVTGGGKNDIRATLCNATTGACSDAR
jgi:hypothetical protein